MQVFSQLRRRKFIMIQAAGISPGEMRVLHGIGGAKDSQGIMVSELSDRLHVSPSFITQISNSLVNQGLVIRARDCNDRRAVRLRLTGKGNDKIQEAVIVAGAGFAGLVKHLGRDQSRELLRLMSIVNDYFADKEGGSDG